MKSTLKVGVVQLASTGDWRRNMDVAISLTRKGIQNGAEFLALPEVFNVRSDLDPSEYWEEVPGKSLAPFQKLAEEHGVYINAGTLCEHVSGEASAFNTSVMINPSGCIQSTYRKIHLFDCHFNGKSILESEKYSSGNDPVISNVRNIKVGMSICYDLRFPELYRHYSAQGCTILLAPASFTRPTGEAHWDLLVRARAVENLSFVIAPNQAGVGAGGIQTFGNSLVVNPWGEVIARGSLDREELIEAELNFNELESYRKRLPALQHRRLQNIG